jgi:protein TonB
MMADKIIILSIIGSLFIHGIALYMTGMVQMRQVVPEEKILTVDLKQEIAEKEKPAPMEISTSRQEAPHTPATLKPEPAPVSKREDTVDLGNPSDTRYKPYLIRIKKKIEHFWGYPAAAAARRMEGTAMIKFSVTADGNLGDILLTNSSGFAILDQGTIAAIQSAAPFEPLPSTYGLAKLNIQASFDYKMSN